MRILILGAGGIGGYFGARLVEAGADVTFLVRAARAQALATRGLVVESPIGDVRFVPRLVAADTLDGTYDLVIVSCKAYDLDDAITAIAPAVCSQTIVVPLLNGLAHLDRLDAAFGAERVIGGVAYISATLAADGTIRHLNKLDGLTYGPRSASQESACLAIEASFANAPFSPKRSPAVMQDMWDKFVFITAAASITCLMRTDVAAIIATRDGARLTRQMLDECHAVAAAAGFPVAAKSRAWADGFLTDPASDFKASMLRDVEHGLRVEADQLPGDMIARGAAYGVTTPLLDVAYAHLQAYEAGRAKR